MIKHSRDLQPLLKNKTLFHLNTVKTLTKCQYNLIRRLLLILRVLVPNSLKEESKEVVGNSI
jgi:hypothetical protein